MTVAAVPVSAVPDETPLSFTGDGAEYFRIWVVNTVLTIATLGIYSAWAKVRKASYFARNTRLLGDGFEFTADPWSVLLGRGLALILIAFYTFAFDFSLTLGLAAMVATAAFAPLLYASALRFRLRNTRWRAIRFEFTGTPRGVYRWLLVVAALWLSPSVAAAVGGERIAIIVGGVWLVVLPWMHHRVKAFQHGHAAFAGHRSKFRSTAGAFYATYVLVVLVLMLVGAGALLIIALPTLISPGVLGGWVHAATAVALLAMAAAYLTAWPYFATRIQRTVWTHTTIGPFAFETSIAFPEAARLIAKNAVLLLLTAGFYWPFATIAWARYRIGCMSIVGANEGIDKTVAAVIPGGSRRTVGEGAVDFFGLDVGW